MRKTEDQTARQARIYKLRRDIKKSIRPPTFEKYHYEYVIRFLRKNWAALGIVVCLIFVQAIIEIAALVFINSSIRERIYAALHTRELLPFMLLALVGSFTYLIVTYFSIKMERTAVLGLINDLRRRLFRQTLGQEPRKMSHENQAHFIAKVSYHLPLLSLGIDHSIFGCIRWILSSSVLLALGLVVGTKQFETSALVVLLSILVGAVAYVIAKHYISQEVTSYSQVIQHISLTLSDFSDTKHLHLEQSAMDKLDARVEMDTYFRIRRDIWLRYFSRVLFVLLFIGAITTFVLAFSNPGIISFFYDPASTILAAIISLYALRLMYEAVQTGLYLPPVRLGLFLSIPKMDHHSLPKIRRERWKEITFKTNKAKIFKEGEYFKNISITFKTGKRYLFVGKAGVGKTNFAHLLVGEGEFNPEAWLVKMDAVRYSMHNWTKAFMGRYLFKTNLSSEKTLGEFILSKDKEDILEEEISKVYDYAKKYPVFSGILSQKRLLGDSLLQFQNNNVSMFAVQTLHCIINNVSLVLINNDFVDLQYDEITEYIKILDKELPHAALVIFGRHTNDIINYEKRYEIKKGFLQII